MSPIKQYHHTTPKLIGKIDYNKYVYGVCPLLGIKWLYEQS